MSTADLIKRCFCAPPHLRSRGRKNPSFAVSHSCAVSKLITHLCLSPVCHLWFCFLIPLCLKTLRPWGGGDSRGDQNRRETLNTGPCVIDAQRELQLHVEAHLGESGVRSGALPLSTKSRWWFAAGRAVVLTQMC